MSHHYIKFEEVSFEYPEGEKGLKQITTTITHGESVALIGANGAGKTTLMKLLLGLYLDFKGQIVVGDLPVREKTLREIRRHIGYVFQDPEAQLFMPTVYEDLAFAPRNYGLSEEEVNSLVMKVLEELGASGLRDRPPYTLSGGEKRIISIATILTLQPDILVMDEPSITLDPASRRRLINLLRGFKHTKLIATHDLDLVMNVCKRTLILDQGELVYDGPTKEILADEAKLTKYGLELPLCLQQARWEEEAQ